MIIKNFNLFFKGSQRLFKLNFFKLYELLIILLIFFLECDLGPFKQLILPPTCIKKNNQKFKINISEKNNTPIAIFINKKSGGKQGIKLMKYFRKILNPSKFFLKIFIIFIFN